MFNEPVKEIKNLHSKEYKWENITPEKVNEELRKIKSDKLHIKCEIENINAIAYTFDFDGDELRYSIRNNTFMLNDEEKVFKYLPELGSKKITYEIILDKTSIEVFVDNGRFTMVLPRNLESENQGIAIVPEYGDLTINIKSLEVYEMKSIWE